MKDIRRLLWLLAGYTLGALIRVLDALRQPRNERGD